MFLNVHDVSDSSDSRVPAVQRSITCTGTSVIVTELGIRNRVLKHTLRVLQIDRNKKELREILLFYLGFCHMST